jgi:hypothetical protein
VLVAGEQLDDGAPVPRACVLTALDEATGKSVWEKTPQPRDARRPTPRERIHDEPTRGRDRHEPLHERERFHGLVELVAIRDHSEDPSR